MHTHTHSPCYSSNDDWSTVVFQLELHWFLYIQVLESWCQRMSHLVSCRNWRHNRSDRRDRRDTPVRNVTRCANQRLTSPVQASCNKTHRFTSGWHQQAGGSIFSWKVQISAGAPLYLLGISRLIDLFRWVPIGLHFHICLYSFRTIWTGFLDLSLISKILLRGVCVPPPPHCVEHHLVGIYIYICI